MVVYETLSETLTRAYSDANMLIERDGVRYEEAVDPKSYGRTYTETNIPIDPDAPGDGEATILDYQQALAELGIEGA